MIHAEFNGRCPICQKDTVYRAEHAWLRDHLLCLTCEGGSIPRERALMLVLENVAPEWRTMRIHESSPGYRGASIALRRGCVNYVMTQFFPGTPLGEMHMGFRCENLEQQTFADESFDIVVSQDVMEHVFHPEQAYREIYRTLKTGGIYIHTTPIYKNLMTSYRRAERLEDGSVRHLVEAEYHGNPIDSSGSLVTYYYGYDIADLIVQWTGFDVEIRRFNDRKHGIIGEFTEVIICRKRHN